ncbi:MAG: hypothetical protein ACOY5Y_12185 [Pseudomonadota bacterium]
MAIYAVSFRLDYDGNYDTRYERLTNAIRAEANGPRYWEESTSFMLLESNKQPSALADSIVAASRLDEKRDLLLAIYLSGSRGHAIRGHYTDKDIIQLLKDR